MVSGLQDGWTPLILAAMNGRIECMKYLISAGASLSQGGKVLYDYHIYSCILVSGLQDGGTSLIYAAQYGHIECMKYLISAGANSEGVQI